MLSEEDAEDVVATELTLKMWFSLVVGVSLLWPTLVAASDFTLRLPHSIGIGASRTSTGQTGRELNGTYFFRNNSLIGFQLGRSSSEDDDIEINQLSLVYATDPLGNWTHMLRFSTEQANSDYIQRRVGYAIGYNWDQVTIEGEIGFQNIGLWNEIQNDYTQSTDPTLAINIDYYKGNWSLGVSSTRVQYRIDPTQLNEEAADFIFSENAIIMATGLIEYSNEIRLGWSRRRWSTDFAINLSKSAVDAGLTRSTQLQFGYTFRHYSASLGLGRALALDDSTDPVQFTDFSFSYSFR